MTSTEFKRLHSLSDKAFRRVRHDILSTYTDLTLGDLMVRRGATSWELLRLDLWEASAMTIASSNDGTRGTDTTAMTALSVDVLPPLPDFRSQVLPASRHYQLTSVSDVREIASRINANGATIAELSALSTHVDRFLDWQLAQDLNNLAQAQDTAESASALVDSIRAKMKVATRHHLQTKAETEAAEQVATAKKQELASLAELLQRLQSQ